MSNNINVIRDIQQGELSPFMRTLLDNSVFSARNIPGGFKPTFHFDTVKPLAESADYSFLVNNFDDINFKKIADDLSYADPLRIVESNDRLWAVVHHTIYDKYLRSELYGTESTPRVPVSTAVMSGVAAIEKSWIKRLVAEIRQIKQARWTDCKKSPGLTPEQRENFIKTVGVKKTIVNNKEYMPVRNFSLWEKILINIGEWAKN